MKNRKTTNIFKGPAGTNIRSGEKGPEKTGGKSGFFSEFKPVFPQSDTAKGLPARIFFLILAFAAGGLSAQQAGGGEDWTRERLLAAALEHNSGYLLAESRDRGARSALSAARAARLPTLRFSADLGYLANPPGVTVDRGAFYPGGGPIPVPLPLEDMRIRLSEKTRYEFGLTLEQPIFTWGRIHHSIKAAGLMSQAAALRIDQEKRDITTTLDVYLATLHSLREIRSLIAEQKKSAERLIVISNESFAQGFILRTDLNTARLLSSEVKLADYEALDGWNGSASALRTLTGLENLDPGAVSPAAWEDRSYSANDLDRLFEDTLRSSLGLRLLALKTRALESLVSAAKGQLYGKPELGLFLQLGYGGPAFPLFQEGWKEDDEYKFTLTLGIRSLLFDGGAVYHGVKQKREDLVQARLEEEKGRRDLREYLEKTLSVLEVSELRQEYLEIKIEASRSLTDQAESAWKSGYGEEREYLSRELVWYSDRIALLREQLAARIAVLRLENITGL
ncbi:MAG: TolC family protein [Treponema sp.]|jgi:outer membrane protein TolC|nr:TolC family protein [Treponema sp.]